MQRPSTAQTVYKLAIAGKQAGFSVEEMIQMLNAGITVDRVAEIILFGVTTGQRDEFDWLFRSGLARLFPQEWDRELYHRSRTPPTSALSASGTVDRPLSAIAGVNRLRIAVIRKLKQRAKKPALQPNRGSR